MIKTLTTKRTKDFWKEFVSKLNCGYYEIHPALSSYMAMRISYRLYVFRGRPINNITVTFHLDTDDYCIANTILDENTVR